jgi:hypothetical protein
MSKAARWCGRRIVPKGMCMGSSVNKKSYRLQVASFGKHRTCNLQQNPQPVSQNISNNETPKTYRTGNY